MQNGSIYAGLMHAKMFAPLLYHISFNREYKYNHVHKNYANEEHIRVSYEF